MCEWFVKDLSLDYLWVVTILVYRLFKVKDIVVKEVVLGSWAHKHLTSSNGVSKESMLCKLYHVIKFLGSMFKASG
jgi:hypothetical protein